MAIREHNDVIVLDTCTADLHLRYGMPMKIRIPSKRRLRKGTEILVRHPGGYSEYEVRHKDSYKSLDVQSKWISSPLPPLSFFVVVNFGLSKRLNYKKKIISMK